MDSQSSSTTYKNLMEDYGSTRDSELWKGRYLQDTIINIRFGIPDILVGLTSENDTSITTELETLEMDSFEEMVAEPLLTLPSDCSESILSISRDKLNSIPICICKYGQKHLTFNLSGCLLCVGEEGGHMSNIALYVPTRLLRVVQQDLLYKGIYCEKSHSKSRDIYTRVAVTPEILEDCLSVSRHSRTRGVTFNHQPVYADGYKRYCPVSMTIRILVVTKLGNRRVPNSSDMTYMKAPKVVTVLPMAVFIPDLPGNNVAEASHKRDVYTTTL